MFVDRKGSTSYQVQMTNQRRLGIGRPGLKTRINNNLLHLNINLTSLNFASLNIFYLFPARN